MSAKKTAAKKTARKSASKAAKSKNEVAPVEEEKQELANVGGEIDFNEDAGAAAEDMGADDLAIPRIRIIQALSKERVKSSDRHIEGIEEGDIFDTLNKKFFNGEKGIVVIPIVYEFQYLEWKTREEGGGLVRNHGKDVTAFKAATRNSKGQMLTKDGTEIVPTGDYYVFVVDVETGDYFPYVISMSKSTRKISKNWNTRMNTLKIEVPDGKGGKKRINPAPFYRSYTLTTIPASNDKGDSYFSWEITNGEATTSFPEGSAIYLAARDFRDQIKEGQVKVAQHDDEGGTGETDKDDSDVPL